MTKSEFESVVPKTDDYAYKLYLADFLREPVIRSAIRALDLPAGSSGLDAGCGIGGPAFLLAEAVSPGGHVTGLDQSPGFLKYARQIAEGSGLSEQISFQQGDVYDLPFAENTFDWIWSSDCVGYYGASIRPVQLIEGIARTLKPGGSLTILGWTSQQVLPGHPALEARLNTASALVAPFKAGNGKSSHFLRVPYWFHEAGLVEIKARTFAGSVLAPLDDNTRSALLSLFEMLWDEARSSVSEQDWDAYQRLYRPDSPDHILDIPDYYAYFTYTMFKGTVPD